VLNGAGSRRVRDDLRERVLSSAQALHYVANAHAQTLARATSSTVGLVMHTSVTRTSRASPAAPSASRLTTVCW
jgi:DNA-binding LacI/PurR family transcriptional regulator